MGYCNLATLKNIVDQYEDEFIIDYHNGSIDLTYSVVNTQIDIDAEKGIMTIDSNELDELRFTVGSVWKVEEEPVTNSDSYFCGAIVLTHLKSME